MRNFKLLILIIIAISNITTNVTLAENVDERVSAANHPQTTLVKCDCIYYS